MNKDWILWGALGCALVGTAHAEYTLGTATGANWLVAATVPGSLDLYVIRALQVRRDVFLAVITMVAANVASRLVHAGIIPVDWRLYSAIGALAPLLLWRIHALLRTQGAPVQVQTHPPVPESAPDAPGWDATYLPAEWTEEYASGAVSTPEEASVPPYPSDEYDPGAPEVTVPELPYLPEGWVRQTYPEYLEDGDEEYTGALGAYLATCEEESIRPSIRGCKEFCKVGQDKAKRLMAYAGYPVQVQS